ncbi:uncharacterized protein LOC122265043 [Penaeus japonicus]|uniref:uncharacterized protein LOC122265043 n=1 Tax=Penaeus japonicus TaxID=27405 RepID=UPI001C70B113|nr:uncharacterized protein LOC122265043 [Penaeus japonicus]
MFNRSPKDANRMKPPAFTPTGCVSLALNCRRRLIKRVYAGARGHSALREAGKIFTPKEDQEADMLRRTILLCLACLVLGQDDFFDKYGYTKIMENCFGASVYEEHLRTLLEAQRGCSGRSFEVMNRPPVTYNNVQFSDNSYRGYAPGNRERNPFDLNYRPNEFQSGFVVYPEVNPTPNESGTFNRPGYRPGLSQYPQVTQTSTNRPAFPSFQVTPTTTRPRFPTTIRPGFSTVISSSTTRPQPPNYSPYPSPTQDSYDFLVDGDRIRTSLAKVEAGIGNLTCALHRLSVIDRDLNIIPQNINRLVFERVTDRDLRQDLLDGINFCREMVQCLPEDRVSTALRYKLQRILAFMKCEKKTRLDACLKHDLRRNINRFDLSALPDDGGRSGHLEKLMTILVGSESLDQLELY